MFRVKEEKLEERLKSMEQEYKMELLAKDNRLSECQSSLLLIQ